MLEQKYDRRKDNLPPKNYEQIKRYTRTISVRIEGEVIMELERLLKAKYRGQKVPMNTISFVIRTAIRKKIRELKE